MRTKLWVILALCLAPFVAWAANGDSMPITVSNLQKIELGELVPVRTLGAMSASDTTCLRSRILSPKSLGGIGTMSTASNAPVISLDVENPAHIIVRFFDDAIFTVQVDQIVEGYAGATVYYGTEVSAQWQTFILVRSPEGTMIATFHDVAKNYAYQLTQQANGTVSIQEWDYARATANAINQDLPPDLIPTPKRALSSASTPAQSAAPISSMAEGQTTYVDILFLFESTATNYIKNKGASSTLFAEQCIAQMNGFLTNSKIEKKQFRICHVLETDYVLQGTNQSLSPDLRYLQNNTNSYVSPLRNQYGADLVVMVVDHGKSDNILGVSAPLSSGTDSTSFIHPYSVNAIRGVEVTLGRTMAHEIGHNLGAGHAYNQSVDIGPQFYSYSSGYYLENYHTIMAYNNDGISWYESAPLFSNPRVMYNDCGELMPCGDAVLADNARTIEEVWPYAVNWRAEVTSEPEMRKIAAPTNIVVNELQTGVELTWTLDTARYFRIFRGTSRDNLVPLVPWTPLGDTPAYLDNATIPGVMYYYVIELGYDEE